MKASTLIKKLQNHINFFGDLPVRFEYSEHDADIGPIVVYDKNGSRPIETAPYEIYLHRKWGSK